MCSVVSKTGLSVVFRKVSFHGPDKTDVFKMIVSCCKGLISDRRNWLKNCARGRTSTHISEIDPMLCVAVSVVMRRESVAGLEIFLLQHGCLFRTLHCSVYNNNEFMHNQITLAAECQCQHSHTHFSQAPG